MAIFTGLGSCGVHRRAHQDLRTHKNSAEARRVQSLQSRKLSWARANGVRGYADSESDLRPVGVGRHGHQRYPGVCTRGPAAGVPAAAEVHILSLLTAKGLSKRYGTRDVLQHVSFSVRQGEVLGLIGPNGAGKTTLFECLAGLTHTDSGEVALRGRSVAASRRKETLFYLPDAIRPWADQRVSLMLEFFGKLYARSTDEIATAVMGLALDELMRSRIGSLSKGELKRTLLALGLLTRQELLLLDEPFDGLDLRQTREVTNTIKSHASQGRTLFLSIHQLNDASRICDRLVLLSAGRVVGEGTLDELKAKAGVPNGGLEEVFLALT